MIKNSSLISKNIFDDIDISLSSHGSSNTTILWEDVPMGTGMSLATSKAIYEVYGKNFQYKSFKNAYR